MTPRIPLAWLLASAFPVAAAEPAGLKAGAFAQDVTPPKLPISVNGGHADRTIKDVDDRLHARCLVLDDGTAVLAFAVVDSCALPRELVEDAKGRAAKATGIPKSHMLISATHTHSAPTATAVFQSDPDPDYVAFLAEKIAAGVAKAYEARQPARIGWAVAANDKEVFNRRWKRQRDSIPADPFGNAADKVQMNPGHQVKGLIERAGPVDPDVSVVSVQTRDGKPLAVLANYSLHYVGGNPNISADYFGTFAERIKSLVGGDESFVGIMSNGTSGDINNIDYGSPAAKAGPGERIRLVAESVAKTAFAAAKTIEYRSDVTLAAAEADIELGVRKGDAKELGRAKDILAKEKDGKNLSGLPAVYARETVKLALSPDKVPVKIQALRVGTLGVAAVPCEVFVEIGLEIKKKSPLKTTFTVELANGYNGYLPTPEQHALGGYETWRARSSYLEVGASPVVTKTVLELLSRVAK